MATGSDAATATVATFTLKAMATRSSAVRSSTLSPSASRGLCKERPLARFVSDGRGDPARQFALRRGADLLRGGLAVLEQDQRRNRADAELAGDGRILVDVELHDLDLA